MSLSYLIKEIKKLIDENNELKRKITVCKKQLGKKPRFVSFASPKGEQMAKEQKKIPIGKYITCENILDLSNVDGTNIIKYLNKFPRFRNIHRPRQKMVILKKNLAKYMVNKLKECRIIPIHIISTNSTLFSKIMPTYFFSNQKEYLTEVITEKNYYDYEKTIKSDNKLHYWVDFANKNLGGGSLGSRGFVQEEIMTYMMIQFADMLAYIKNDNLEAMKIKDNGAIIMENLLITGQVRKEYSMPLKGKSFYGSRAVDFIQDMYPINDFFRSNYNDFEGIFNKIIQTPKHCVYGNIIALDAVDHGNSGDKLNPNDIDDYSNEELSKLFQKAFSAFYCVRQRHPKKEIYIHTGAWGTGAFSNELLTMLGVQLLAAQYSGIDYIKFWLNSQDWDKTRTGDIVDMSKKIKEKLDYLR